MYDESKRLWVLVLNKYQRDNLITLLTEVIGYGGHPPIEPFGMLNTGDWVGEVAQGLGAFQPEPPPIMGEEESGRNPNMSAWELREKVEAWVDRKRLDLLPSISYNEDEGDSDE